MAQQLRALATFVQNPDSFLGVHIAPADPGDGTVFVGKLFSDLKCFFFVHNIFPRLF